jgi:hypothetical protein
MSTKGFSFPEGASMDEVEELVGQGLDAMCKAFYAGNEGVSVVFSNESIVLEGVKDTKKDNNSDDDEKKTIQTRMSRATTTLQQERFSMKKRCAWDATKIPAFFFVTKNASSHSTRRNTAWFRLGRMPRRTMKEGRSCTDS